MSGLEVIGSIASVAQLAGTVYSISKQLYEVGDALSKAPSDIKDLARDLETFSEELQLLSTLLDGKNNRYSNQVYRLTAKIIGDCAKICVKIDKILKKLRSGSVWARVKWLYKEKEIMKLLARLRDLKLSLMGTLSVLSALKADYMMDAMGVPNPSLLEGGKGEEISKETMDDIENTRRLLEGISMGKETEVQFDRGAITPKPSAGSTESLGGSTLVTQTSNESKDSDFAEKDSMKTLSVLMSANSSILQLSVPPLISFNAIMHNPQAMASVESFQTARSHFDPDQTQDTPWGNFKSRKTHPAASTVSSGPENVQGLGLENKNEASHEKWRTDAIESAMRHFKLSRSDAEKWAAALPSPQPQHEYQQELLAATELPLFDEHSSSEEPLYDEYSSGEEYVPCGTRTASQIPHPVVEEVEDLSPDLDLGARNSSETIPQDFQFDEELHSAPDVEMKFPAEFTASNEAEVPRRIQPKSPPLHLSHFSMTYPTSEPRKRGRLSQEGIALKKAEPIARGEVMPIRLTIACIACRQKHAKCDGKHPYCRNCKRLGLICNYKDGRRKSVSVDTPAEGVVDMAMDDAHTPADSLQEEEAFTDTISTINVNLRYAQDAESSFNSPRNKDKTGSLPAEEDILFPLTPAGNRYGPPAHPREIVHSDKKPHMARDTDEESVIRPYEYEDVKSELAHSVKAIPPCDRRQPNTQPPGSFGDDLDFTATDAAGLQDTGFDPNIGIDDLSSYRRASPHAEQADQPLADRNKNLACKADEDDRDAWIETTKVKKRRKRRSSSSVQKMTLSQSIGSDANDENLANIVEEEEPSATPFSEVDVNLRHAQDAEASSTWHENLNHINDASTPATSHYITSPAFTPTSPAYSPVSNAEADSRGDYLSKLPSSAIQIEGGLGKLDSLRRYPRFGALEQASRQNPQMTEMALQQIIISNPQLTKMIGENQGGFLQLLDEDGGDSEPLPQEPLLRFGSRAPPLNTSSSLGTSLSAPIAFPAPGFGQTTSAETKLEELKKSKKKKVRQTTTQLNSCRHKSFNTARKPTDDKVRLNEAGQLWWRAFARLREQSAGDGSNISKMWLEAFNSNNSDDSISAVRSEIDSQQIAQTSYTKFTLIKEIVFQEIQALTNANSKVAVTSVQRIAEILKVIESTLKFKTGGLTWICFFACCNEIFIHTCSPSLSKLNPILSHLVEIATIISRYNVMESMYQSWPGMSLEEKYEDSLVGLCVEVLRYLDSLIDVLRKAGGLAGLKLDVFNKQMRDIEGADAKCRGFTVTILEENGRKWEVEDLSSSEEDENDDDNDDDDGARLKHKGKRSLEEKGERDTGVDDQVEVAEELLRKRGKISIGKRFIDLKTIV